MDARDSNSGSHTCSASAFSHLSTLIFEFLKINVCVYVSVYGFVNMSVMLMEPTVC